MTWPLVWRSTYDRTIRELTESKTRGAAAEHTLIMVLDRWVHFNEMLLAGMVPAPKAVSTNKPLPMAVPERSEIADAIELSAGGDRALARHLEKWAKQQRLDGMKEHDIIQSIIHWRNAAVWDGDTDDAPAFL